MKWKVLALINLVWSFGYAAEGGESCPVGQPEESMYTLQLYKLVKNDSGEFETLADGQVKVDQNFINSFQVLINMVEDLGDVTEENVISVQNLDNNKFDILQNLLQKGTQEAVTQEFNRLALQDQIELLQTLDFLAPQNTLLGTFEIRSNNHLIQAFVRNLHQQIEANQIDQDFLDELNQDEYVKNLIINNLQLPKWWVMGQRLGVVYTLNQDLGHIKDITSVVVSRDRRIIVTGSKDHTAIVWRQNERGEWVMGQRLGEINNLNPVLGHIKGITSVAVSQDGRMIVTGSKDHTAIVWRQNERGQWVMGQRLGVVDNENPAVGYIKDITSVAVSQNGRMIVTGSADRTAIVWNLVNGKWAIGQRLGVVDNENPDLGHIKGITSVAVSQNGRMIVTGSKDHTAIVWNLVDGEWVMGQRLGVVDNQRSVVGHGDGITSLAVPQDGAMIVTGSVDNTAIVWRQNERGEWVIGQLLGKFDNQNQAVGHIFTVSSVAVSQDGVMIVTGSVDRTAIVWRQNERGEWVIGQRLGEVNNKNENLGHFSAVFSVAVSRDARMIVTGSFDSTAIVWKEVDFFYILNVEEIAEWLVKKRLAKYQARLERERLEREVNFKLIKLLQANNIEIDLLLLAEKETLENAIKLEQDTTAIILMIQQRLENEVWKEMSAIIQSGSLEEAFDNKGDFGNNRVKRKEQHDSNKVHSIIAHQKKKNNSVENEAGPANLSQLKEERKKDMERNRAKRKEQPRTELDSDSDEEVDPRDKRKDTKNKG